jgi:DNA-binding MarR family transcriptional regulator
MKKAFIEQFRQILRDFGREINLQNSASCCRGISVAQCHTLLEIEKHREISVTDLARNLSLDKSTVSRTVDGLVNIRWWTGLFLRKTGDWPC